MRKKEISSCRNLVTSSRENQTAPLSLSKTRRVVADGFARADGSRGVRIARTIDARDGNLLDAAMTTATNQLLPNWTTFFGVI